MQDLSIHRMEIHSKLVAIMRERLAANLRALSGIAAAWGGGPPGPKQPSNFAQTNAKQLRILNQVAAAPLGRCMSNTSYSFYSILIDTLWNFTVTLVLLSSDTVAAWIGPPHGWGCDPGRSLLWRA